MTWLAWADPATGTILRVCAQGEPAPGYGEETHRLIALTDEEYEAVRAGEIGAVDADGTLLPPPPEPELSEEDRAEAAAARQRAQAEAWLARMPASVLDLIVERVREQVADS